MKVELVRVRDLDTERFPPSDRSLIYYILVDGLMIPNGWSENLEEATEIYNTIISNPLFLETRKEVLQSTTI